MDRPSPSKTHRRASSKLNRIPSPWKIDSSTKLPSFSPAPPKRAVRAWERRPVSSFKPSGKQRKIWKRTEQPDQRLPDHMEDIPLHTSSPKKVLKKARLEGDIATEAGRGRQPAVASSFERRRSFLPHKIPQSLDTIPTLNENISHQATNNSYELDSSFNKDPENTNLENTFNFKPPMVIQETTAVSSADIAAERADRIRQVSSVFRNTDEVERNAVSIEDESKASLDGVSYEQLPEDVFEETALTLSRNSHNLREAPVDALGADSEHQIDSPTIDHSTSIDKVYRQSIGASTPEAYYRLIPEPPRSPLLSISNIVHTSSSNDPHAAAMDEHATTCNFNSHTEDSDELLWGSPEIQEMRSVSRPSVVDELSTSTNTKNFGPSETFESGCKNQTYLDAESTTNFESKSRRRTAKGDTLVDIQIMTISSEDDGNEEQEDDDPTGEQYADSEQSLEGMVESEIYVADVVSQPAICEDEMNQDAVLSGHRVHDVAEDTTCDIDISLLPSSATELNKDQISPSRAQFSCSAGHNIDFTGLDDTLDIIMTAPTINDSLMSPRRSPRRRHTKDEKARTSEIPSPNVVRSNLSETNHSDDCFSSPTREITSTIKVQLNDDDTMLRDFLSRSRASKAARIAKRSSDCNRRDSDIVKHALASPARVLEDKDINSPSQARPAIREASVSNLLELRNSPLRAKGLTQNSAVIDEGVACLPEAPGRRTRNQPPRLGKQATLFPNVISLKGSETTERLKMGRTEAQDLAMLTRSNTKRNKGGAEPANIVLMRLKSESHIIEPSQPMETTSDTDKAVRWNQELVMYFDETLRSTPEMSTNSTVTTTKPRTRRVATLGAVNGTPAKTQKTTSPDIPIEVTQAKVEAASHSEKPTVPPTSRAGRGRIPMMTKKARPQVDEEKENIAGRAEETTKAGLKSQFSFASNERRLAMPRRGIVARR